MRTLFFLFAAFCVVGSAGLAVNAPAAPTPAPAPTAGEARSSVSAGALAECERMKVIAAALRVQRDAATAALQDAQVQLQLALQKVEQLDREVAELRKAQSPAAEQPSTPTEK